MLRGKVYTRVSGGGGGGGGGGEGAAGWGGGGGGGGIHPPPLPECCPLLEVRLPIFFSG